MISTGKRWKMDGKLTVMCTVILTVVALAGCQTEEEAAHQKAIAAAKQAAAATGKPQQLDWQDGKTKTVVVAEPPAPGAVKQEVIRTETKKKLLSGDHATTSKTRDEMQPEVKPKQ